MAKALCLHFIRLGKKQNRSVLRHVKPHRELQGPSRHVQGMAGLTLVAGGACHDPGVFAPRSSTDTAAPQKPSRDPTYHWCSLCAGASSGPTHAILKQPLASQPPLLPSTLITPQADPTAPFPPSVPRVIGMSLHGPGPAGLDDKAGSQTDQCLAAGICADLPLPLLRLYFFKHRSPIPSCIHHLGTKPLETRPKDFEDPDRATSPHQVAGLWPIPFWKDPGPQAPQGPVQHSTQSQVGTLA